MYHAVCNGKRYNREARKFVTRERPFTITHMTVERLTFFENVPSIRRKVQTLYDVGYPIRVLVILPPHFQEVAQK